MDEDNRYRFDRLEWQRVHLALSILVSLAILAVVAVILTMGAARAHEALPTAAQPEGWTYGYECCSSFDCRPLSPAEVKEGLDGYRIALTGETIPYDDKRIKRSRDEFFHQCTPGGKIDADRSICLYVPDRGF